MSSFEKTSLQVTRGKFTEDTRCLKRFAETLGEIWRTSVLGIYNELADFNFSVACRKIKNKTGEYNSYYMINNMIDLLFLVSICLIFLNNLFNFVRKTRDREAGGVGGVPLLLALCLWG